MAEEKKMRERKGREREREREREAGQDGKGPPGRKEHTESLVA